VRWLRAVRGAGDVPSAARQCLGPARQGVAARRPSRTSMRSNSRPLPLAPAPAPAPAPQFSAMTASKVNSNDNGEVHHLVCSCSCGVCCACGCVCSRAPFVAAAVGRSGPERGARMEARTFSPVHGCTVGAAPAPSLRSVENPSQLPRTRRFIAGATSGSPFFCLLFFTSGFLPSALRAAFGVPARSCRPCDDSKKSDSAAADRAKRRPRRSLGMNETLPRSQN